MIIALKNIINTIDDKIAEMTREIRKQYDYIDENLYDARLHERTDRLIETLNTVKCLKERRSELYDTREIIEKCIAADNGNITGYLDKIKSTGRLLDDVSKVLVEVITAATLPEETPTEQN